MLKMLLFYVRYLRCCTSCDILLSYPLRPATNESPFYCIYKPANYTKSKHLSTYKYSNTLLVALYIDTQPTILKIQLLFPFNLLHTLFASSLVITNPTTNLVKRDDCRPTLPSRYLDSVH